MIKFFRRIRSKLIDEKNLKKYIIYAGGEILLVMIGILLALQVNSWNNNRLNRNLEKINLQAISEKMNHNQFQLEIGINQYNSVIRAAEDLLKINFDSNYSLSLVEENLYKLTKRFLFGKSNSIHIYDELINSGQLSNISSQQLRNSLSTLKGQLQLLESYEDIQCNFVDNQLAPYLNKNVDRIYIGETGMKTDTSYYSKSIAIDYSTFHKHKMEHSYKELLKSHEFTNLLLELVIHTKTFLPIYKRIETNISVIDSLVILSEASFNQ